MRVAVWVWFWVCGCGSGGHACAHHSLGSQEDEISTALHQEKDKFIRQLTASEEKRNRMRVAEICNMHDFQAEELDQLLAET